jgi:hypothetical protein
MIPFSLEYWAALNTGHISWQSQLIDPVSEEAAASARFYNYNILPTVDLNEALTMHTYTDSAPPMTPIASIMLTDAQTGLSPAHSSSSIPEIPDDTLIGRATWYTPSPPKATWYNTAPRPLFVSETLAYPREISDAINTAHDTMSDFVRHMDDALPLMEAPLEDVSAELISAMSSSTESLIFEAPSADVSADLASAMLSATDAFDEDDLFVNNMQTDEDTPFVDIFSQGTPDTTDMEEETSFIIQPTVQEPDFTIPPQSEEACPTDPFSWRRWITQHLNKNGIEHAGVLTGLTSMGSQIYSLIRRCFQGYFTWDTLVADLVAIGSTFATTAIHLSLGVVRSIEDALGTVLTTFVTGLMPTLMEPVNNCVFDASKVTPLFAKIMAIVTGFILSLVAPKAETLFTKNVVNVGKLKKGVEDSMDLVNEITWSFFGIDLIGKKATEALLDKLVKAGMDLRSRPVDSWDAHYIKECEVWHDSAQQLLKVIGREINVAPLTAMLAVIQCNITEAKAFERGKLSRLIPAAFWFWGDPGHGKTETVQDVVRQMAAHLKEDAKTYKIRPSNHYGHYSGERFLVCDEMGAAPKASEKSSLSSDLNELLSGSMKNLPGAALSEKHQYPQFFTTHFCSNAEPATLDIGMGPEAWQAFLTRVEVIKVIHTAHRVNRGRTNQVWAPDHSDMWFAWQTKDADGLAAFNAFCQTSGCPQTGAINGGVVDLNYKQLVLLHMFLVARNVQQYKHHRSTNAVPKPLFPSMVLPTPLDVFTNNMQDSSSETIVLPHVTWIAGPPGIGKTVTVRQYMNIIQACSKRPIHYLVAFDDTIPDSAIIVCDDVFEADDPAAFLHFVNRLSTDECVIVLSNIGPKKHNAYPSSWFRDLSGLERRDFSSDCPGFARRAGWERTGNGLNRFVYFGYEGALTIQDGSVTTWTNEMMMQDWDKHVTTSTLDLMYHMPDIPPFEKKDADVWLHYNGRMSVNPSDVLRLFPRASVSLRAMRQWNSLLRLLSQIKQESFGDAAIVRGWLRALNTIIPGIRIRLCFTDCDIWFSRNRLWIVRDVPQPEIRVRGDILDIVADGKEFRTTRTAIHCVENEESDSTEPDYLVAAELKTLYPNVYLAILETHPQTWQESVSLWWRKLWAAIYSGWKKLCSYHSLIGPIIKGLAAATIIASSASAAYSWLAPKASALWSTTKGRFRSIAEIYGADHTPSEVFENDDHPFWDFIPQAKGKTKRTQRGKPNTYQHKGKTIGFNIHGKEYRDSTPDNADHKEEIEAIKDGIRDPTAWRGDVVRATTRSGRDVYAQFSPDTATFNSVDPEAWHNHADWQNQMADIHSSASPSQIDPFIAKCKQNTVSVRSGERMLAMGFMLTQHVGVTPYHVVNSPDPMNKVYDDRFTKHGKVLWKSPVHELAFFGLFDDEECTKPYHGEYSDMLKYLPNEGYLHFIRRAWVFLQRPGVSLIEGGQFVYEPTVVTLNANREWRSGLGRMAFSDNISATTEGSCGSPYWTLDNHGNIQLIGVHVAYSRPQNTALCTTVTREIWNDFCTGAPVNQSTGPIKTLDHPALADTHLSIPVEYPEGLLDDVKPLSSSIVMPDLMPTGPGLALIGRVWNPRSVDGNKNYRPVQIPGISDIFPHERAPALPMDEACIVAGDRLKPDRLGNKFLPYVRMAAAETNVTRSRKDFDRLSRHAAEIGKHYANLANAQGMTPYTVKDAMSGNDDQEPIKLDTSVGAWYQARFKVNTKSDLWEILSNGNAAFKSNEAGVFLRKTISKQWSLAAEGIRYSIPASGKLKAEKLPLEKVWKKRVFVIVGPHDVINLRRILGPIQALLGKLKARSPFIIQSDPVVVWDAIRLELLSKGNNILPWDASSYDWTIPSSVMNASVSFYAQFYRSGNTSEDYQMYKCILRSLIMEHALKPIIIGDSLIAKQGGVISGMYGTSLIDSTTMLIMLYDAFRMLTKADCSEFIAHVVTKHGGDDCIESVSDKYIDVYNFQTIRQYCYDNFGISLTLDKKDEDFQGLSVPLAEASFLGRTWIHMENYPSVYQPKIRTSAVSGALQWTTLDSDADLSVQLYGAHLELVSYGRQMYSDFCHSLRRWAEQRKLKLPTLPSFEEAERDRMLAIQGQRKPAEFIQVVNLQSFATNKVFKKPLEQYHANSQRKIMAEIRTALNKHIASFTTFAELAANEDVQTIGLLSEKLLDTDLVTVKTHNQKPNTTIPFPKTSSFWSFVGMLQRQHKAIDTPKWTSYLERIADVTPSHFKEPVASCIRLFQNDPSSLTSCNDYQNWAQWMGASTHFANNMDAAPPTETSAGVGTVTAASAIVSATELQLGTEMAAPASSIVVPPTQVKDQASTPLMGGVGYVSALAQFAGFSDGAIHQMYNYRLLRELSIGTSTAAGTTLFQQALNPFDTNCVGPFTAWFAKIHKRFHPGFIEFQINQAAPAPVFGQIGIYHIPTGARPASLTHDHLQMYNHIIIGMDDKQTYSIQCPLTTMDELVAIDRDTAGSKDFGRLVIVSRTPIQNAYGSALTIPLRVEVRLSEDARYSMPELDKLNSGGGGATAPTPPGFTFRPVVDGFRMLASEYPESQPISTTMFTITPTGELYNMLPTGDPNLDPADYALKTPVFYSGGELQVNDPRWPEDNPSGFRPRNIDTAWKGSCRVGKSDPQWTLGPGNVEDDFDNIVAGQNEILINAATNFIHETEEHDLEMMYTGIEFNRNLGVDTVNSGLKAAAIDQEFDKAPSTDVYGWGMKDELQTLQATPDIVIITTPDIVPGEIRQHRAVKIGPFDYKGKLKYTSSTLSNGVLTAFEADINSPFTTNGALVAYVDKGTGVNIPNGYALLRFWSPNNPLPGTTAGIKGHTYPLSAEEIAYQRYLRSWFRDNAGILSFAWSLGDSGGRSVATVIMNQFGCFVRTATPHLLHDTEAALWNWTRLGTMPTEFPSVDSLPTEGWTDRQVTITLSRDKCATLNVPAATAWADSNRPMPATIHLDYETSERFMRHNKINNRVFGLFANNSLTSTFNLSPSETPMNHWYTVDWENETMDHTSWPAHSPDPIPAMQARNPAIIAGAAQGGGTAASGLFSMIGAIATTAMNNSTQKGMQKTGNAFAGEQAALDRALAVKMQEKDLLMKQERQNKAYGASAYANQLRV